MKRLKILFATLLFLSAVPLWRYLDMLAWLNLNGLFTVFCFFIWSTVCLILPTSLIYRRVLIPGLILNICFSFLIYFFANPFSSHTVDHPEERHCSLLNFSGFFYNFKAVLPSAHADDLLIRNQICWARKLSLSIPDNLSKHESSVYLKLIEEKLTLPELKWKTTLPFLIPIYLKISKVDPIVDTVEAQKFWNNHYTAELQIRDYNFLSYPHSDYIKWEYRILEKYWSEFLDNVEITRNPEE